MLSVQDLPCLFWHHIGILFHNLIDTDCERRYDQMAEYIDRNLIEWFGCDFEDGSCEYKECSECSQAECLHTQVMQIPVADVVERREINKVLNRVYEMRDKARYACAHGCCDQDDLLNIIEQMAKLFKEI